ncbi:MAG TPA: DUF493 domain-containing protein [Deltaproteobacteria bacterium]|nr:DUF493 domain-containing protein [Deltaproteobacteria bacterium]
MKFVPIKGDLTITYPCTWVFKIFGTDHRQLRLAARDALSGHDYAINPSHSSRNRKYHCMNIDITVSDDQERTGIYEALRSHSSIILVL